MKLHRSGWLFGLLATAVCLAGCTSAKPEGASREMVVPAIYKQNCLSCHGNQLQGRVGPNLQKVGSRLSQDELIQVIHDGKGGMPAYGKRLTEEEIASIASWLSGQR